MEDQEQSSPWEKMKQARERQPEFNKKPIKASVKQAIRYLMKVSFLDFIRLQFPKATEVPDSDMYFGWYVPKQNAAAATWTVLSKRERPDRQRVRKPIIIAGRRFGIFGTVVGFLLFTLTLSILRSVLLP